MAIVRYNPNRWLMAPWWDDEETSEASDGLVVFETTDNVVVQTRVPGVAEDEINIDLEGRTLTIRAAHEEKEEEKKGKRLFKGSLSSSFIYSTTIPAPIQTNKVKAVLEKGVLTVTLPKSEEAKPRKIQIEAKGKK